MGKNEVRTLQNGSGKHTVSFQQTNVGRFKGGLWEKYIAHEQAHSSDHRWPKRNMGHLWRNMRVCMGKIEFET